MIAPPEFSSPDAVAFEILHGCNFGCTFCYINEHVPGKQEVMLPPLDTTFGILDELARSCVREVYLVGGEPTMHPKFSVICQRIAELGFPVRGVVTNGTLLTMQMVNVLRSCGFWVDVSFRSMDLGEQARIVRRTGTLSRVLNGIRLLNQAEIGVCLEFDCLPSNAASLLDSVEWLLTQEIILEAVYLHRIAPHGTASRNHVHDALDIVAYRDLLRQAANLKERYHLPVIFEDGLPLCLIEASSWDHVQPCDCGRSLLTIDPIGNARRCACHPAVLGNVLHTPLQAIWRHGLAEFRSGDWHATACHTCEVLDRCGGGCPVSSPTSPGYAADVFSAKFRPISVGGGSACTFGPNAVCGDGCE